MTIIKQRAVTEKGHQRNLRAYINDDKKVLLRDSQNMEDCKNLNRWATFMEETRKAFGHDKAARRVRDKKTGELVQAVIRQIRRCLLRQIKTGLTEHLTMV